jgi:Flp pilus assembly protein TadD
VTGIHTKPPDLKIIDAPMPNPDKQSLNPGETVNIAVQHYEAGRLNPAAQVCLDILQKDPHNAHVLHLSGAIAYRKGLYKQAIDLIREAIKQNRHVPQFHNTLGVTLRAVGAFQEAIVAYEQAISLDSEYCLAYMNMGNALMSQAQFPAAVEKYSHAISLDPKSVENYNSMAIAFQYLGEYEAAIEKCKQALLLRPDFAEAYNTLASVFMKQGHCNEAIENYRQALQLKPDYTEAHCNLGMSYLLSGQFEEGWAEYRWRLKTQNSACSHRYHVPVWDGSPFEGKRLVVHFEQGFGDNIQFIRYLPMVKRRGGTVICEMLAPLSVLLRKFPGIDELVNAPFGNKPRMKSDLHVPLLELPRIFGTTLQTIPGTIPYIQADSIKAEYWRNRLAGPHFKVGIVWAGDPAHKEDKSRSCHLRHFLRLSKIPNVQLIGLQKGTPARQVKDLEGKISLTNFADELNDFSDTAAVIENLDLVISIDTAVLHLAGAMGKRVWAILSSAPDWRWMIDRQDSPWYPTMRLFRQKKYGDWESVFKCIVDNLEIIGSKQTIPTR